MDQEKARKLVEEDLSNYPYWIISERLPGLGSATRWDKIGKSYSGTSSVEHSLLESDKITWKISVVEAVMDRLDKKSKTIIEKRYFYDKEDFCIEEILKEFSISKTKLYSLRNKALDKFAVALRYIE